MIGRFLRIALLLLPTVTAVGQTDISQPRRVPANASLQLKTTVATNKAQPGDSMRFETLDAVLIGNGVVIPAGATIYGHVIDSRRRDGGHPSFIKFQLDYAKWKTRVVPLRGYVTQQIRQFGQPDTLPGIVLESRFIWDKSQDNKPSKRIVAPTIDGVKIYQDKDAGVTYLFSDKRDLTLPKGIEFNIQIIPTAAAEVPSFTAAVPQQLEPAPGSDAEPTAEPEESLPASQEQ